jgi:hypothetical protein
MIYSGLNVVTNVHFVRKLSSGLLELSDEPPVVLGPVDGRDVEDGAADAALVVVVVGLAAESEVEALERSRLEETNSFRSPENGMSSKKP